MNRKTKYIVAGIVVILLIVLGFNYFKKGPNTVADNDIPPLPEAGLKVYQSQTYGYSFQYPEQFALRDTNPALISVGTTTGGIFESYVDVAVVSTDTGNQTYTEFLEREAKLSCAVDTRRFSTSCTEITRSEPYTTATDLTGTVLFLNEETRNLTTRATTTQERGPFFAFDISGKNPQRKFAAVIVRAPFTTPQEQAQTEIVESIARSIRVGK